MPPKRKRSDSATDGAVLEDAPVAKVASTSSERSWWLMKGDADFTIEDLAKRPGQTNHWDGVRNHQAKNFIKKMKEGDLVYFYQTGKVPAVTGIVKVVKEAYPDFTCWEGPRYDAKSTRENPIWVMVDVKLVETFKTPLPLKVMKENVTKLSNLMILRVGRLSVCPVIEEEWETILRLQKENEKATSK